MAQANNIVPLKADHLEFGIHAYQQFSCRVPAGTTIDQLIHKDFWAFVISKIVIGAEIRVIPVDFAYRAQLLVTYTDGYNIRLKVISYIELDDVKPELLATTAQEYILVQRGQQKWCIQRKADSTYIKELIPTKADGVAWLDKYIASVEGDLDATAWLDKQDY